MGGILGIRSQSMGVLGPLIGNSLWFPVLADVGWLLAVDFTYERLYIKMILQGCSSHRSALCGVWYKLKIIKEKRYIFCT